MNTGQDRRHAACARALPATVWRTAGSGRVAAGLLFLLSLDLVAGYLSLRSRTTIFEPMNQVGLWSWMTSYGEADLRHTAWFLVFLVLLGLLAVNTLACTWQRLSRLPGQGPGQDLYRRLAIHGMHIGVLLLLCGYLASYTLSTVSPSVILVEEKAVTDPVSGLRLRLEKLRLPRFGGQRLPSFAGRVIRPEGCLLVSNEHGRRMARLGFNSPVRFRGWTIFLQRFAPTGRSGMDGPGYVVVDLRRDPGVLLSISGLALVLAAMTAWSYLVLRTRR